jgi:hypothetical protein
MNVYSNDVPVVGIDLMLLNSGTPSQASIEPLSVTLPPIGTGALAIELVSIPMGDQLPPVIGLDAITVSFNGPVSGSCCVGRVGDANGSGEDEPTIGDVSVIIDALFIGENWDVIACMAEADINQSGGADPQQGDITIGDVSYLIDYLFITGSDSMTLPDCL